MSKSFYSLGFMSGTSMDGVDASIIKSDGKTKYKAILDKYFKYPKNIYLNLTTLRDNIKSSKDLKKYQQKIKLVEKEITMFHAKAANEILKKTKVNIDFIGFHGQTIFHNAKKKLSRQLGNGKILSRLTKKTVVYDFRQNDLKNGGHGAPLVPIFHKVLSKKLKITYSYFLNIGGITNYTLVKKNNLSANDIGPGMCLIDRWLRTNSKKKYDKEGKLARLGNVDFNILENAYRKYKKIKKSRTYDVKDFDESFVKDMSLKDGVATLTEFTIKYLIPYLKFVEENNLNLVLCGGGRKNKFLTSRIKKFISKFNLIDDFGIDGDFIESKAFAYLAIRSYLNLPITFPNTTGCKKSCTGGKIVNNF